MSQFSYCRFILDNEELVRQYVRDDRQEMILNIAEKGTKSYYKLSSKQMYRIEEVYYHIYPIWCKYQEEQERRSKLSEFDRLWEDNSDYYIDYDTEWGSGKIEYMTKETFKDIYDELTSKIKELESEVSGHNYWKR